MPSELHCNFWLLLVTGPTACISRPSQGPCSAPSCRRGAGGGEDKEDFPQLSPSLHSAGRKSKQKERKLEKRRYKEDGSEPARGGTTPRARPARPPSNKTGVPKDTQPPPKGTNQITTELLSKELISLTTAPTHRGRQMLTPQPRPAPQEARPQKGSKVVSIPTGTSGEGGKLAHACNMYKTQRARAKKTLFRTRQREARRKTHQMSGSAYRNPGT